MSDLHFGTERPEVIAALEHLVRDLSPAVGILSGDITQRARRVEFDAAEALMRRLSMPSTLVLPGNHDIPLFDALTRFLAPYARYRRVFGRELEPVLDSPDLLAIGVCTTRRYRHIEGEVSGRQIERVAQRLKRSKSSQLRIVVTHQPVYAKHAEDQEHILRGRERAIEAWWEAGADLILGGHIHRPFVHGLHENHSTTRRPLWVVQAGTAVSKRIRHDSNNSVNVIRYGFERLNRCCEVERWDYCEGEEAFVMIERRVLTLAAN